MYYLAIFWMQRIWPHDDIIFKYLKKFGIANIKQKKQWKYRIIKSLFNSHIHTHTHTHLHTRARTHIYIYRCINMQYIDKPKSNYYPRSK